MSGFAWVTLATNDSYSLGALVLAHSLKQVGTAHQLAVLVTPGVTNLMRKNLADVFNVVQEVNLFDSKDEANLRLLKRPELGVTFTKLHCWRLTQYEKCVFLDADVLVLVNADELFERDEFSAAPDIGWPDCFNSGVFVYRPSLETYNRLVEFALQKGSFDGGDQGLLNSYFSDWAHKDISKHLPFIYNMCSTACYSYLPAFKYYGANVKIVHFIGPAKPWLQYFDTESRKVHPSPDLQHLQEVLQRWWDVFCSLIHPKLTPDMSGLAGAFAQFTLGVKRSPSQDALENHLRRQAWEVGNIDYMGRDSFDNIWSKICQSLSGTQLKDGAVSSTETQQVPELPKATPEVVLAEVPKPVEEVKQAEEPVTQIKGVEPDVSVQQTIVQPDVIPQPEPVVLEPPKQDESIIPPQEASQPVLPEEVKAVEETTEQSIEPEAISAKEEPKVESQPELAAAEIESEPKTPASEQEPEAPPAKEEPEVQSPPEVVAKVESQPEAAAPKKEPEVQSQPEVVAKVESQPETAAPKEERKVQSEPGVAAPKDEPKVEPELEAASKDEPKAKSEADVVIPKEEPKLGESLAPKEEPILELQLAAKEEPKLESQVISKEEPKLESQPIPKEEPKLESQPISKEEPKLEPQPEIAAAKEEPKVESPPAELAVLKEEVQSPAPQVEDSVSKAQQIPLKKDESKLEQPKVSEGKVEQVPEEPKVLKQESAQSEGAKPVVKDVSATPKPTEKVKKAPVTPQPKTDIKESKPKAAKAEAALAAKEEVKPDITPAAVEPESSKPSDSPKEEAGTEAPKSDTKPKETKKIKKKVKKVPKAEVGDSPDGAAPSKK